MRHIWLKHGFWNTLEHGLTRVADAGTSIVLLWALSTETFSRLALAQAWVAPLLLLFISPEAVLYRDFARWKEEGPSALAARLRALRLFGWGKGQAAVVVALAGAWVLKTSGFGDGVSTWSTQFFALLWAFALVLSPQISGADREFLRLDLRLRELNAISLYQKASLLVGTLAAAFMCPDRVDLLAIVAVLSVLTTAWLARWRVRSALYQMGATREALAGRVGPSYVRTLSDALGTFSIWTHLSGVLANWIQSMDVFFLGVFRFPAREVGLYAAALKLANFSFAAPIALSNLFSIWVGRRTQTQDGRARELYEVKRLSFWLALGAIAQALVLAAMAPWIFEFLSHGRWTGEEQARMVHWFYWILLGSGILSSTFLVGSWLVLRQRVDQLFYRISLPWVGFSILAYAGATWWAGPDGAAMANGVVSGINVMLMGMFLNSLARKRKES
jgi:hypothetical protein